MQVVFNADIISRMNRIVALAQELNAAGPNETTFERKAYGVSEALLALESGLASGEELDVHGLVDMLKDSHEVMNKLLGK